MARPRRIIPQAVYLITRRTLLRTFRLRPDPITNQIATYCLAWAAERASILVHSVVVMSDHVQIVLTDPLGQLPLFLRDLDRNIAKALNVSQGMRGILWDPVQTNVVRLGTLDDVVDKIAYVAANPVIHGLVARPEEWPGLLAYEVGSPIAAKRPPVYFDPKGPSPEQAELRIVAPMGSGDQKDWMDRVRRAIADKVKAAHESMRAAGRKFPGPERVMRASIHDRAQSIEPDVHTVPVVASHDPGVRDRLLQEFRGFQVTYRAAFLAWRDGDRAAEFPFGTWGMRLHHHARVAPAPDYG